MLLSEFALAEKEGERTSQVRGRVCSLFALRLSGTEAKPHIREAVVRRVLFSNEANERRLGLGMLKAAFQSRHWFSPGPFEFGARQRSYGYIPSTRQEEIRWYRRFVALCKSAATADDPGLADGARELLANEFRALWRFQGLRETLAALAKDLNHQKPWLEGWRAVRSIKYYNSRKATGQEILGGAELLDEVDQMLGPRGLSDKVRNYVLTFDLDRFALDDEFEPDCEHRDGESRNRAATMARDLGMLVADQAEVMREISLELFTARTGYLYDFGSGLASKSNDLRVLWDCLVKCFRVAGNTANCGVLRGVLAGIHDRDESLARRILDEAVSDTLLRRVIVSLQTSIPWGPPSVERMGRALDFEDTPLEQFAGLVWHRPLDVLSETEGRNLLSKILHRPGGARVVLDGLVMRIHLLQQDNLTLGPELKKLGLYACAELLRHESYIDNGGLTDHGLSKVLKSCVDESELVEDTSAVFDALVVWLNKSYSDVLFVEMTLTVLAERATAHFLDRLFFDPTFQDYLRHSIMREQSDAKNPLSNVRTAKLLEWCEKGNFQDRLLMISEAVFPFEERAGGAGTVFSEQALAILYETQDPSAVLANFACFTRPSGWSGSMADIIAKRCQPFEALLVHNRPDFRRATQEQVARIKKWETQERELERRLYEEREQGFE